MNNTLPSSPELVDAPSKPETLWFQSFDSEARQINFTNFSNYNIEINPDVKTMVDSSLKLATDNLYRSLFLASQKELRSEIMQPESLTVTESKAVEQNKIQELIKSKFETASETMAQAISHYILANSGSTPNRIGESKLYITPANVAQITSIIHGLGLSLDDSTYSDLVYDIVAPTEQNLSQASTEKIYQYLSVMPPNALVSGVRALGQSSLNQGQFKLEPTQQRIIKGINIAQLLNDQQKKLVLDYALNTPDSASKKVVSELVKTAQLPRTTAVAAVEKHLLATNDPLKVEFYQQILASLSISPQTEAAQVQQAFTDFETAQSIAGHDVSNPALSGSKWVSLAAFYGGALSSIVTIGMALGSGHPSSVFGALPSAFIAAGGFQGIQGKNPLDAFASIGESLNISEESKQELTRKEWANSIAKLTLTQRPPALEVLASDVFIKTLLDAIPEDKGDDISLAPFETRLKAADLPTYKAYFENYAADFSSNRDVLKQNLTQLAYGYKSLEINSNQDYMIKIAQPRGVEKLTPNS